MISDRLEPTGQDHLGRPCRPIGEPFAITKVGFVYRAALYPDGVVRPIPVGVAVEKPRPDAAIVQAVGRA